MSKKHKEQSFGIETLMRLGVFAVLIYLAIGFLSNSKSNLNIPSINPSVLGAATPQIEQGQKWLEKEYNNLKAQALDQIFTKIKESILK